MEGACIGVYMKGCLDDLSREILKIYERYVMEDTPLCLIAPEWNQIPTYTEYERQQLTEVYGQFAEQVTWIFGDCDRIFVAAYEIIVHFGGLLDVNLGGKRE